MVTRTKKTPLLNELVADHSDGLQGGTFTAYPVDTGNPHANRNDHVDGETAPLFTPGSEVGFSTVAGATRSQMVAMVVDKMLSMQPNALEELVTRMFGPENVGNPASIMAGQKALGSVKGNPGAVQPALDTGMINYAAAVNAAAGDTSIQQRDALPAADPSGLATEEVKELLGGETLSEEAIKKIATLFESAVNTKVRLYEAELVDEYQERLEEGVEEAIETIVEHVDRYTTATAEQFINENKLAFVDTARVQICEGFMAKFKDLLEESSIEISSEDINVVEAAKEEIQIAEEVASNSLKEVQELRAQLAAARKALVLEQASVGLSVDQRSKLQALSESVGFESADTYADKIKVLKEQRVLVAPPKSDVNGSDVNRIGHEDLLNEGVKSTNPSIDRIANVIAKQAAAAKVFDIPKR